MSLLNKTSIILSGIVFMGPLFAANAEQIIVRDCSKMIRATSTLSKDSSASVKILHSDGGEILIRSNKTPDSDSIKASESNGKQSIFSNITAGDWIACGGKIDEVQFITKDSANGGVSLLAAGTGILAGASAIAFGNQGGSNSSSGIASDITGSTNAEDVASPQSAPAASSQTKSDAASRCLNDSNISDMSQSN